MTHTKNEEKEEVVVFYLPNVNYEITLNLDDKYQHYTKETRLEKVVSNYSGIMDGLRSLMDYELYVELSEPRVGNIERGSVSRIHYHGVIRFKDELSVGEFLLHKQYLLKRSVDYSINSYRKEYWNKYIKKQECIMKPLCTLHNCPYIISSTRPIFKSISS